MAGCPGMRFELNSLPHSPNSERLMDNKGNRAFTSILKLTQRSYQAPLALSVLICAIKINRTFPPTWILRGLNEVTVEQRSVQPCLASSKRSVHVSCDAAVAISWRSKKSLCPGENSVSLPR